MPVPSHGIVGNAYIPLWRSNWQAGGEVSRSTGLATVVFAEGFERPVGIGHADDGSGRLFIMEQGGRVLIVEDGRTLGTPFLDISDRTACCGERGLLGFVMHPDFRSNGTFYVHYTTHDDTSVVERYLVSTEDPNRAEVDSAYTVLTVPQPGPTHNGGHLAFGPDGYLYVGVGDGTHSASLRSPAQRSDTLLGKILRIDVGHEPYAIPLDNPHAGDDAKKGEIWALGLRNPWRFSFDRLTGDMYIGDVGQSTWEEINIIPAGRGGKNFGWPAMEGGECRRDCATVTASLPALTYGHDLGCSVTGGYVYRGEQMKHLQGTYVYGDFCSGRIWGAHHQQDGWSSHELIRVSANISSFGEDEQGELYFADYGLGVIYGLAAAD